MNAYCINPGCILNNFRKSAKSSKTLTSFILSSYLRIAINFSSLFYFKVYIILYIKSIFFFNKINKITLMNAYGTNPGSLQKLPLIQIKVRKPSNHLFLHPV